MWEIGIWDASSISGLGDWQDVTIHGDGTTAKGADIGEEAGFGTCWAWIDLRLYK